MRPGLRPLLVLVALSAALAHATLPPFDFTGTWTGTVASRFDSVGMNFTLTSTGPRTFSGSVTFGPFENDPGAGATCRVNGTYGKRVKLHLRCPHARGQKGMTTLRAHLDPTAETMSGPCHLWVRGHGRHRAQFALMKN
jgi:hypothetical protein